MKNSSPALASFLFIAAVASVNADSGHLDPDRIGWSEIRYHASKLFFSVDANVALSQPAAAGVSERLMEPGEGAAIVSDANVQELVFTTNFLGRHTTSGLLINAATGATLQRTSHDSGTRFRHRIYRFTDIGAYQKTRWPIGKAEEKLPAERWEEWSDFGEGLRAYPPDAVGRVVTDSAGLLYIVGAAQLYEPGDKIEILAYARSHVHRVHIEVVEPEAIKVDYRERDGETTVDRNGKQQVMTLLIRGEGLDDGDAKNKFELLGLRGDITMHMDSKTRAPLQLSGNVKIAGKVILRAKNLVLL